MKTLQKERLKASKTIKQKPELEWAPPGIYLLSLVLIIAMLAPVVFVIIGGFRTNSQITNDPSGTPDPWIFQNYMDVLTGDMFWKQILNSLITAAGTTLGVVLLGLMVSFALARYKFKLSKVVYSVFAAGLMFPMTVAITPLYILIRDLGLMNNLLGIILPQIAFGLPMTIIILVPFLRAIPNEIQEAAEMDGCTMLGFFVRMVIPLAVPGVITTGILAFIGSWNGYMLPLFILNDPEKFTLPLGVQAFSSQYSVDTAKVLAFTSLSMIPALVFFSLFERRIVGGLTGAVKG